MTMLTMLGLHLLLAVVVDYDIILVRAFDRVNPALEFKDRMTEAMGYVHRTILVSIAVGALAFLLGSIIDLPILVYFCLHSFYGLIGLYISLFTIFLGCFVMCEQTTKDDELEEGDEGLAAVEGENIAEELDEQPSQQHEDLATVVKEGRVLKLDCLGLQKNFLL